jgi:uncharacterized protein (DUF608 family)
MKRRDFFKAVGVASALSGEPAGVAAKAATATEDASRTVKPLPYTAEQLLGRPMRSRYAGDYLNMIAFPVGGIGAGCISLSGTGKLVDWEIFNRPNKGYQPRFSFLSVWAKPEFGTSVFRVLEGQLRERLDGPLYLPSGMFEEGNGVGPQQTQAAGLPRMRECWFEGKFPFATVHLADKSLPVVAEIEAWSPFIPGNSPESSLPVVVLNVTLRNVAQRSTTAVLAVNVQNRAGEYNEMLRARGASILHLHDGAAGGKAMFVATPETVTTWQTNWQPGHNFISLQHFVDTFARNGRFDTTGEAVTGDEPLIDLAAAPAKDENAKVGSIGVPMVLGPGQSHTVPVIIGWYFPVFEPEDMHDVAEGIADWRNYYAVQWKSGLDVAQYTLDNLPRLEEDTRLFQRTFFSQTLPGCVLEGISSQLAILRSPTVIRYPDGMLYGYEGCAPDRRLGFGTCNHVWNYQQAIPYLFPDLQRSMLENFYFNGLRESDGAVQFRMPLGPGAKAEQFRGDYAYADGTKSKWWTAADGQFGMVCQVYREYLVSGDLEWLRKIWPRVKKSLEYAWVEWDKDRDGLLEGSHHNTLDLNFSTPETMCGSMYQAALLAGERMATIMREPEAAAAFRQVYESAKRLTDEKLYNGEYYHQMLPAPGDYQLAEGCISEQVGGQLYASMLGLEDIYDRRHIDNALASLFRFNYRESFHDHVNCDRAYSINDDRGLLIATWPKGGKPEKPLLYCDETQAGYEYQVAGNLLYAGYILEGLTVFNSIRDRYDGRKRNPFCEFEWGNHYARSMCNYSALLALSHLRYSAPEKSLHLMPAVYASDFKVFFGAGSGWGTAAQKVKNGKHRMHVQVAKGKLGVSKLQVRIRGHVVGAVADIGGRRIGAKVAGAAPLWTVELEAPTEATPGQDLMVEIDVAAGKDA